MDNKVIIINNTFNLDTHPLFENQPIDVIESIFAAIDSSVGETI